MEKNLPNFLIVGAAKAGTSSLYQYLKQHPDVFLPTCKEPSYFVHGYQGYGAIRDYNSYLQLFKDASGKKAIGEASTAYLTCEISPWLIRKVLGEIKIIILLRNPAKRAFSLYSWTIMEGYENAKTFEDGLANEELRMSDQHFREYCPEWLPNFMYLSSGMYYQQVKRYLDVFGRDRVRIHIFEEFVGTPLSVCKDLFDFLNVSNEFTPTIRVYNKSRVPRSISLQYFLRSKALRASKLAPFGLSSKARSLVMRLMQLNVLYGKKSEMPKTLYKKLLEQYRIDISQLEDLLGRDLSIWYGSES